METNTISDLIARTFSSPNPNRSIAPGRKFCTSTSAVSTNRFTTASPGPVFASIDNDRLLRLLHWKESLRPSLVPPTFRINSPLGVSTLITSAP